MRNRFRFLLAALLGLALVRCNSGKHELMLVGTYTNTDSKGIYVFDFNSSDGTLTELSTMEGIENPSYVTSYGDRVYAVSETGKGTPGSIFSYKLDRKSGALTLLGSQLTGGDDPCYAEADSSGSFVAVANYSGGSVALFRADSKGALENEKQLVQHIGNGADPERQQGPHAHQAVFTPDQSYLLVPDLGKDRVMIYMFARGADVNLVYSGEVVCDPGSGPRHLAFHPSGKWFYLINELKPVIEVYQFDKGQATFLQRIRTTAAAEGNNDGAEVKVSPDGKFLYSSQRRDDNTIGIYAIDQQTGQLTGNGFVPCGGTGPRDFNIDPSGKFLIVANQKSNNIVVFRIDKKSGSLTQKHEIAVPIPVSINFVTQE